MKNIFLKFQLRKSGADKKAAGELDRLARQLGGAYPALRSEKKRKIAEQIGFKPVHANTQRGFVLAGSFASIIILVIVAQAAQPGSLLYALKRGSEEVRVQVQPGFEEELAERRKDELEKLKRDKAEEDRVKEAQKDYEKSLKRSGKSDDRGSGKNRGGDGRSGSDSSGSDSSRDDSRDRSEDSDSSDDSDNRDRSGSGNSGRDRDGD